jgi:hypothetical protein
MHAWVYIFFILIYLLIYDIVSYTLRYCHSTSELRRSSAARYSASSVKEVVVPLDSNIKYRKYKFPKNPTVLDYVLAVPRNISFYFNNLSRAFGVKFVLLVCIVYGLQQGNPILCNLSYMHSTPVLHFIRYLCSP